MGSVTYNASFTRNMGDYEFIKLDIGVTDEPRGEELFDEAYNRVKDFVESKLLAGVEELELQVASTREQAVEEFRNWKKNQK